MISPPETARIEPVTDHETDQIAAGCSMTLTFHWPPPSDQMTTFRSCAHEAMTAPPETPGVADHATSRTQSVCTAGRTALSTHAWSVLRTSSTYLPHAGGVDHSE